ncbi:DUF305 domain-containing protein [Janibacter sp. G1551]|uniref:DUF305 domain-containing protein n=1 Tax=Janibacter sp. G1551 TaxID=3420440 RepID=UPI003D06AAAC
MHLSKRYAILAGTGLAATLALSACGDDQSTDSGSMGMNHSSSSPAPSGSASVTAPAGDVMFAQMMIPHHEQAVEMAELALQNDSASKEVTDLATEIKAAQGPEIETMNRWLREWNAPPSGGSMDHGSGGMMTEADMQKLSGATGEDFNRMWVTMMIEHHEGAVDMAEGVLQTTSNPEVKQMAQAIVDGQKKEIATMKGML